MKKLLCTIIFLLLFASSVFGADIWRNPGPFTEGMDTWFGSVYSTSAQHDYRLRVGGWGDEYDTLVRFNLSGLPQTATQAVLYMYAINEGTPTNIYWYFNNSQWYSDTVTWNTKPSGTYLGSTSAPSPNGWYGVGITNQYNQWRSGNTSTLNYGLRLKPVSTNNNYSSFYSSTQGGGYGPWLKVSYTPQSNDNIIKLKWPLATSYSSRVVTQSFGDDWAGGAECPEGVIKKHNGTDYSATAGTVVYAAEDGVVKEIFNSTSSGWAYAVVIEHISPTDTDYTTTYWHITPSSSIKANGFVPKGMQIGTVANLTPYGHSTHFHLGVRMSGYATSVSVSGSLPQAICNGYPAFSEYFVNPENQNNVIFQ